MERDEARRDPSPDEAPLGPPTAERSPDPLPWPPPGLARIQGDAWEVSRKLSVAGLILVVPLILTMSAREPFEIGGALGDAWWLAAVTTVVGILLLGYAIRDTGRLLGRSVQALGRGHGGLTVALAAADRSRDMGFLLQGRRHYSALSASGRRALARIRIAAGALLLLGSLWIPMGFALALFLGTRGLLEGPASVLGITLVPYGAAILVAVALLAGDKVSVRRARRRWHKQPWVEDLEREAIGEWRGLFGDRVDPAVAGPGDPGGARGVRGVRGVRVLVYAGGATTVLVALVLAGAMFLASAIATVSTPILGTRTLVRMADVEPLRRYVVQPDPNLGPQEAGEILQVLLAAGSEAEERPLLRAPIRRFPEPWLPEPPENGEGPNPLDPEWRASLLERARSGLEAWELAYLRDAVGHPAAAELSRLAGAPAIDVFHGRLESPLPAGTSLMALPFPRFGALRDGAVVHHLLSSALLAAEGREDEAELRIREVISVGLLMADESPTLMDNLLGAVVAGMGGDGLEALFRGTGRTAEARDLAWARAAAARSVERRGTRPRPTSAQGLREMRHIAADGSTLRGLRWEMFLGFNTVAPCVNLDRIVFGPGAEYREWTLTVRESLVRWPSEEEIFEAGRYGYFGRAGPPEAPPRLVRPVTWLLGGGEEPGSCGAALSQMARVH